jgi:nicotinate-nucleotide adenylyltransferase
MLTLGAMTSKRYICLLAGSDQSQTLYLALNELETQLPFLDDVVIDSDQLIPLENRDQVHTSLVMAKSIDQYKHQNLNWVMLTDVEELELPFGGILCEALGKLWELFDKLPTQYSKLALPVAYSDKSTVNRDKRITFYGGTFNPWHEGHQTCLDLCPREDIIIVLDHSPFKGKTRLGCPWVQYKNLAARFQETTYSVYPGHAGTKTPKPTATWIKQVPQPAKEFIIGDDNFLCIETWNQASELLNSLTTLFVIPRGHYQELAHKRKILLKDYPQLDIQILSHHPYEGVSSTQIRKQKLSKS